MPVSFVANHRWNHATGYLVWEKYSDSLLRVIAGKTIKPRQKLTGPELRKRLARWADNPPQVDRRLKEISPTARTLLDVLRLGKRNHWHVGTLLELAASLHGCRPAETDGLKVIEELFLHGLLLPDVAGLDAKLSNFEDWLGQGATGHFQAWITPQVLSRANFQFETLPPLEGSSIEVGAVQEADGLEWFLRLAVLWQQLHDLPARMTRQGGFFKRDQERLAGDALLNPSADFFVSLREPGSLLVALGLQLGMFATADTQLETRAFPESWRVSWPAALADLLGAGAELTCWSVDRGWRGLASSTSPFSSALLLLLALLMKQKDSRWCAVSDLCAWLTTHHCYWSAMENPPDLSLSVQALLLGWLYPLRIIQTAPITKGDDGAASTKIRPGGDSQETPSWALRLSPFGRSLLNDDPITRPVQDRRKMLLIQPNMEMIAYRQGLTPSTIADLSETASWTGLGSACTLHLDQASIHRGLEQGATFESISGALQLHAAHGIPGNVFEAIRTWAAKRDRITVYERANILEFLSQTDRDTALGRGLGGVPIADRYLLIEDEHSLDFRHFRSLGTRDYALPPMTCVAVAEDGVSLSIDNSKADLLVETELERFSIPKPPNHAATADNSTFPASGFLVSPQSLAAARLAGLSLRFLEEWFWRRTGKPPPAAVRLLWDERNGEFARLSQPIILTLPEESVADGLWQWPETRELLQERIGPFSFLISPDHLAALQKKLEEIAYPIQSYLEFESKLP